MAAELPFSRSCFFIRRRSASVASFEITRAAETRRFRNFIACCGLAACFFAFEIRDGWLQRAGHIHGTFVPVFARQCILRALPLQAFPRIAVDIERRGFRVCALRATEA